MKEGRRIAPPETRLRIIPVSQNYPQIISKIYLKNYQTISLSVVAIGHLENAKAILAPNLGFVIAIFEREGGEGSQGWPLATPWL